MNGEFAVVRANVSSVAPTLGELQIEGQHFCYTLERPWLDNQPDTSCIPTGTYQVILSYSTRFARDMPRLIGVPGRTGILIHVLNEVTETEGCIGVGDKILGEDLLNSRAAFDRFLTWFDSVGSEALVTISNSQSTPPPETT